MFQRCLLPPHQIVTSFQTGILDLFLGEQSYVKILHHHYKIKRGSAGPFAFWDTSLIFFTREYVHFSHIGQDILLIFSHLEC